MTISLLLFGLACSDKEANGTMDTAVENQLPTATISFPQSNASLIENSAVVLEGTASDANDPLDSLTVEWIINDRQVCPPLTPDPDGQSSCETTILLDDSSVEMLVQDPSGGSALDTSNITVVPEDAPEDPVSPPTLTFQLDLGTDYTGSATVGNSIQGWDTAGMIQLTDSDGDGVFTGSMSVEAGQLIEYKFIKGYDGNGEWEVVPVECGLQTGEYINRSITMPDSDHTLPVVPFSGCPNDSEPDNTLCGSAPGRSTPITINGRQILDGATPLHLKGVAWSPTPIGGAPWSGGADFSGAVAQDAQLMADAGINAVRTYSPITDVTVLDELWSHGIYVLMTVYYGYSETPESATQTLCAVKDHPAILAWVAGNEWNYDTSIASQSDIQAVLEMLSENDSTRPVSTIYGGLPDSAMLSALSVVDIWGLNVYTGASFGGLFSDWEGASVKPMYFGEYGADAWNGITNQEDQALQSTIVQSLTQEIFDNSSANNGSCFGGMLFEFNDEWWKYSGGSEWSHDTTNSWENGAYSDPGMNEEWWGIVDIYRQPRMAYDTYAAMSAPAN